MKLYDICLSRYSPVKKIPEDKYRHYGFLLQHTGNGEYVVISNPVDESGIPFIFVPKENV